MARDCGFCHPPPEDSHDREMMDRFGEFLDLADGPPDDRAVRRRILDAVHHDPDVRELVFGSRDIHGPAF